MFDYFDFTLLNSSEFKEDSVREELITPLLHSLGYKAHGDFKIIRSKNLLHPFVRIGSKKNKVHIVPDYVLKVKNNFALVLDAKNPNENIINGTHVEQVYSYAIHPEIRSKLYALCNGRELTVFHINQNQPVTRFKLCEIAQKREEFENLLSPYTILNYKPKPQNLYPDYGLHLLELGYTNPNLSHYFYNVPIDNITRISDEPVFSISNNFAPDGVEFAISFDFNLEMFTSLINLAPIDQQSGIIDALQKYPYKIDILPPFTVNIEAKIGALTQTEFEKIIPLVVTNFF